MPLRIQIEEGGMFPRGYGVAYRDWPTLTAVCYPMPLNVLIGWSRRVLFWVMHGVAMGKLERDLALKVFAARRDGIATGRAQMTDRLATDTLRSYERGLQEGWRRAFDHLRDQIGKK